MTEEMNYGEQSISILAQMNWGKACMKVLPPPAPSQRSFTRARSECRVIIYKPDVTHLYLSQFLVSNWWV